MNISFFPNRATSCWLLGSSDVLAGFWIASYACREVSAGKSSLWGVPCRRGGSIIYASVEPL
jgi:hypothetical protein